MICIFYERLTPLAFPSIIIIIITTRTTTITVIIIVVGVVIIIINRHLMDQTYQLLVLQY